MPKRNGLQRRTTGLGELSEEQITFLIHGWVIDSITAGMADEHGRPVPFQSWETCERAYRQHKKEILTMTKTRKCANGSAFDPDLPWAFWRWEATEPKLQLKGPKPLKSGSPEAWKGFFGQPVLWNNYEEAMASVFETDAEYCERMRIQI